ncbi:LysR family transcriptional regulator [Roseomonas sp. BN140053]|uniref:LysR family transcriptional regulator n=1 Tax=Roseomonas sp. BN140053 TaxID=3391898 RepID=UPI0039E7F65F
MDRVAQMTVFRRVVEAGGLTRAAQSLGMGQPNVSRLLSELEARLGVPLLHRSPRGLRPTEAGQHFYEEAGKALTAIEEAEDSVRREEATLRGTLRVAASPSFFRRTVVPWLPEFLREHPGLNLDLLLGDGEVDLLAAGVDMALRAGPVRQESLIARHLGRFALNLYASPVYLAERGTPGTPEGLAGHDMCLHRITGHAIRLEDAAGRQVEVPVSGRVRADDVAVLVTAAEAGLGLVQLPPWRAFVRLERETLVPVLPDWHSEPRDIYAVWPATRALPRRVRVFVDMLAARFASDPRLSLRSGAALGGTAGGRNAASG